ncbi:MAG: PH domain-containing protein [Halapricum sp.]
MQLDPLSIPYRSVERGLQAVVGVAIAGVAGAGSIGGPEGIAVFAVVLLLGIALSIGWQVAYYRRFEYRITEDTFDIDSGVLSRRSREIPYGRIQNVDIRQNVIQRVLGIAEVRLETAGGGQTEAQLRYVSREDAEYVQEEVSRRKRGENGGPAAEETATEPGAKLFELTGHELLILGVVSMDLRLLSLLAVPLSIVGPSVFADVAPAGATIAFFVVGALALVVGSAVVSGALSMARYYGFVLTDRPEEYRYERGLLQRFSGSIPKDKVQTITLTENVIARLLGYASLSIETAGYAGANGNAGSSSQSAIPIAERDRAVDLAGRMEDFQGLSFERPPKRARERYIVRYGIVLAVLIAIAYGIVRFTALSFPWYALLAGVPLVPVAAHLKWTHRGYRLEDDHVITRNGFWSRRITVIPTYRIQTLVTSETVFQRRRDLATLVVDTAGTYSLMGDDAKAVDIDVAAAERLREELEGDLQEAIVEYRRQRRESDQLVGRDDIHTPERISDG